MHYHHDTLKVGRLPPVKCPRHFICPGQIPPPSQLPPFVKAHTKLPILAAYRDLAAGYENGDRCEVWICG